MKRTIIVFISLVALLVFGLVLSLSVVQQIVPTTASTSLLFYDGFEDGDGFAKWTGTEPWDLKARDYWNASVVSTSSYKELYSAQIAWTQASQWGGYYKDISFEAGGIPEAYWRVYVRFNRLPTAGADVTFLWIVAQGPPPWATREPCGDHLGAGIVLSKDGTMTSLYVRRYHPDQTYYSVPHDFQTNRWYSFELGVRRADDGWYRVWIDGTLVFSEETDTSMAPELGAATIISSSARYQSYPAIVWYDECAASNYYIGPETTPQGTLIVESRPIAAECFVNGSSWGLTPQSRNVQAGTHEVSWANVDGYYSPNPQIVTVNENETVTVVGEYAEVPQGICKLSIFSDPVQGIEVQISNDTHALTIKTGEPIFLTTGIYDITATTTVTITFETWTFAYWSDGHTDTSRKITLTSDTVMLYYYSKG